MVFNMGRPTIRWVGNEDGLAADSCLYEVDGQYLPPECDVPIRRHWFWQPDDLHTLKSAEHLLGIYYRSVGLGAGLLLNVPPDRRGLLDDADRERLLGLGAEVRRRFGSGTRAAPDAGGTVRFDVPVEFDHLVLTEDLRTGQRIRQHEVIADDGTVIARGGTVGVRRIHPVGRRRAGTLTIRADGPVESVTAHCTGSESAPRLEEQPEMLAGKVDQP
jgi:alpha-L-fucosidase